MTGRDGGAVSEDVILSFDVGIINLGYCVLRIPSMQKVKRSYVRKWICSITGELQDDHTHRMTDDDDIHADPNELCKPLPRLTGIVMDWDVLCLAREGERAKDISLSNLAQRLFKALDGLWNKYGSRIRTVLIENQPSRLNGHMKSIQMLIYSYFMYKIYQQRESLESEEAQLVDDPPFEVQFINATGKLQTHVQAEKYIPTDLMNMDKGYKRNKVWSIHLCNYYVRDDKELQDRMLSHKKKDDLCDAMLQAIGWYHRKYRNIKEVDCVKSS